MTKKEQKPLSERLKPRKSKGEKKQYKIVEDFNLFVIDKQISGTKGEIFKGQLKYVNQLLRIKLLEVNE